MGINPNGNTQKVQKTEITSLHDFRELSVHKSNKVITKNFTAFISGSDPSISRLCTFLIFEAKRNNTLEFTTHLLTKYGAYLKASQKKFGYKDTRFKNSSLPVTRKDFMYLISTGIIIPINAEKKLFLMNPALTYHYDRYNEQAMFMKEYENLYTQFAIGGLPKIALKGSLISLGREYYNNCLTKNY